MSNERGKFNFEAPIVNGKVQGYRHVGKYRVRADARDIVTGKATFLDDFTVPRMIYARILRSPFAHAKIKHIDTSKAKAMKGVQGVYTYEDLPDGWILGWPPHKLLLDDEVYYAGDPVAVVAADTLDIADEAGGIATIATILALEKISIKNIGIIHNREFEEGVLKIEFYDGSSMEKGAALLKKRNYIVYER